MRCYCCDAETEEVKQDGVPVCNKCQEIIEKTIRSFDTTNETLVDEGED